VRVLAGVQVGSGASFVLGVDHGPATGTIGGGLAADHAAEVIVHDARINGGVTIQGGSGPFGCIPFGACITLLEGNSINGGATINGYTGFFLGFIRNHVNGSVTISNNVQTLDEIDIGSNVVHGSLTCAGNNPLENTGDSPGPTPDTVTGQNTCHEVTA
jgi:serine acetyltransferase